MSDGSGRQQRHSVSSRRCVSCGRQAAAYCAGCGVTPYCGDRCQRRDWGERHRAVCHNLARLSGGRGRDYDDENDQDEHTIPPATPLRAPHAAAARGGAGRGEHKRDDEGEGSDTNVKKYNNKPDNKSNNRFPRNNMMNKRPQGDMRRPNTKPNAEAQDDEWPKDENQPEPTPATPPVKPQPTVNKLYNEAPTYKSLREPQNQREMVKEAKPVQETSPVKQPVAVTAPVKPPVAVTAPVKQAVKEPAPVKPPVAVTAPVKLVPEHYVIGTLDIGECAVLSVDALASACRSSRGFVCLSMCERYAGEYELLCDSFGEACAANTSEHRLVPGELCSYLEPADGGWYRARCVADNTLALLDASRLAAVDAASRCAPLPPYYRAVPEFCCLLLADGVQVGMSLTCTLVSKTAEVCRVSIVNNETGAELGVGEVLRWTPTIDYPVASSAAASIPEVSRPEVSHASRVLLVHASAMDAVYVRPADVGSQRTYDDVLEQVALHGRNESPLTEPPSKGQTVLGQFSDGLHYRALCKRTNVKQNKYLLEYIEFGNMEISPLEKLYPCPDSLELATLPALVSRVALADSDVELTPPALEYVEQLKQDNEEIILTVASGAKAAASGSVVTLTLAKNRESINTKLQDMCTPEWKKIEQRGGDVIESARLMYSDVEYVPLGAGAGALRVLHAGLLAAGVLAACPLPLPHARHVLGPLTDKMAEYCNSEIGRQPYLPKAEELCIAQFPPYPQWFRAVLAKQVDGPGGASARVFYLDYGNVEVVPVALLRKMLPEFIVGLPVLASHIIIRDFPENPTESQLTRAREFLRIDDEGRGQLAVARCERHDADSFIVDAPDFIAHVLATD